MKYYSLNKQAPDTDFRHATIAGQAMDGGLYYPTRIPVHDSSYYNKIQSFSNEAIAYTVIAPYVGNTIPDKDLKNIVEQTVNFPLPLVQVNDDIFSLELYHGPTMAFKDVGARFMSRCLGYFLKGSRQRVVVLVATSGDTGGAAANGFYQVEGVDVVVLYPSGKISKVQEAQITTLGHNIHALEVQGTFDDCQRMVKKAFADEILTKKLFLTSANSINVARWLPQQFYYFFAWKQWPDKEHPPIISVPSGNFGNICAGLLAYSSGLPVKKFVAACNANKVVTDYLASGQYHPGPAIATLSNAMDVGQPSNFERILQLFDNRYDNLKKMISSYSINDEETIQTIREIKNRYGYLMDPHGAVAYAALQKELSGQEEKKGIFLETAHPVKFNDTITRIIGHNVLPEKEGELLLNGTKEAKIIDIDYENLKTYLQEVFS